MTKQGTVSATALQHSLQAVLERVQSGTDLAVTQDDRVVAWLVAPSAYGDERAAAVGEERAVYASETRLADLDGAVTQLVSTPAVRRVLALFIRQPALEIHQREVSRRTRLGLRSVQLALKRLVGMGVLAERRDGNRLYYRAVRSERFERLRALLSREFGIAEVLARHLADLQTPVTWAFVFGSAARGDDRMDSDIDLLVVTDASDDELVGPIAEAQRELDREIDLVSYRPVEFTTKLDEGNHFLRSIMSQSRVDVIGGEHDACCLGGT